MQNSRAFVHLIPILEKLMIISYEEYVINIDVNDICNIIGVIHKKIDNKGINI